MHTHHTGCVAYQPRAPACGEGPEEKHCCDQLSLGVQGEAGAKSLGETYIKGGTT